MTFDEFQRLADTTFGLAVSLSRYELLSRYASMLYSWSDRVRLISKTDREFIWERHLLDCLSIIPHLPEDGPVLDLGSGAGLPGIPTKAMRPDLNVILLEPARMKSLFLRQVISDLHLPGLATLRLRAETLAKDTDHRGCYRAVVARAVAPLPELWSLSLPLLCDGGRLIAMKGPGEAESLRALNLMHLQISESIIRLPFLERDRALVSVWRENVSRETSQS